MLSLQGFTRSAGRLHIIAVTVDFVLPAGTQMFNGLARSPEGALYVVFA